MKKHMTTSIKIIIIVALMAIFNACKTAPPASSPVGEVEVIVPCSGSEYFSTNEVFRANSIGESSDQVISKKKALTNVRAELAASIQTTVKTVTDNYVNSREFNNKEEVEERFESLNREVVNQEISGTAVICEKQMRTSEGRYKTYMALEIAASDLLQAYNERLSKDERLKIDYDYEKFKKTFDEEMSKMGN
ncbi:MAG: hypothetical protein ABJG78_03500 [Cyclobacteriaceae bacterium]